MKTRNSTGTKRRKTSRGGHLRLEESVLAIFPPVSRMGGSKPSDWKAVNSAVSNYLNTGDCHENVK